ncbi:CobW family GTP-binding protein [Paenibacillus allorhizosphaerae]|uniref:Metal chaperone YciC n=1 Tax=Paenibacillus allorhizosphaerae TaxID=2849866 RepID=A0ABN7TI31_9BACL|nr:GTP-binding protein [Paenibacillus allorhizosphaerae]CAG7628639.1 Putative metal chaperone YciC [Paenibacillus allorhizosphaerae]
MKQAVPVHILTGFLGSGKTTLLTQALDYYKSLGQKPAVLMNELGDVNLDGMMLGAEVPMSEMLGGCICCTIRGDLGMELKQLVDEHAPDVVFVECTGAANPIEILDGVTDASLLTAMELRSVVTVVDAAQLSERSAKPKAKTFRLMEDQIRCATQLLLNKADLVEPEELVRLEALLREWNPSAPIARTVKCAVDMSLFDRLSGRPDHRQLHESTAGDHIHSEACGHGEHCGHTHHDEKHGHDGHHHTHEHVMVYTHYFQTPIDSESFEALIGKLPAQIYRAKGILRFTDTISPFLFQYAYREMDFVKIAPKEEVPNVAVFIGEHFDKSELVDELAKLEAQQA